MHTMIFLSMVIIIAIGAVSQVDEVHVEYWPHSHCPSSDDNNNAGLSAAFAIVLLQKKNLICSYLI